MSARGVIVSSTPERFPCDLCDRVYSDRRALVWHSQAAHPEEHPGPAPYPWPWLARGKAKPVREARVLPLFRRKDGAS